MYVYMILHYTSDVLLYIKAIRSTNSEIYYSYSLSLNFSPLCGWSLWWSPVNNKMILDTAVLLYSIRF